jgi:hypothetical protein
VPAKGASSELLVVLSLALFSRTAPAETTVNRFPKESSTTIVTTNKKSWFDLLDI